MIDLFLQPFLSLFNFIGPFLLLLGILIVIHEIGHLLAAKYFGVRVETFSVGFGKKILSYKYGETTYCVSLFPLGGYVKMFGDDPSNEVPESEKKYAFLHQSFLAKIVIAFAGPFMNLILAVFLFAFLNLLGQPMPAPIVGDIRPNTPAYEAGFRSGDHIQKINQKKIKTWNEVQNILRKNKEKSLEFEVKREKVGQLHSIQVSPTASKNKDISSFKKSVGEVKGLTPFSLMPILGLNTSRDSPAAKAGFRNFDRVLSVNGKKILYLRELKREIQKNSSPTLSFKVRNETPDSLKFIFGSSASKEKSLNKKENTSPLKEETSEAEERLLTLNTQDVLNKKPGNIPLSLNTLGLVSMELVLSSVVKNSPADKAGLQPGDRVLFINKQAISHWRELSEAIQSYDPKEGTPLSLRVLRGKEEMSYEIIPQYKKMLQQQATYTTQEKKYILGVTHIDIRALAPHTVVKEKNWIKAFFYGWEQSFQTTVAIAAHIVALIQNKISPRNIAGVITIGRYANRYFEAGIVAFLKLMALFSINLFLINLFPIPILDGGHILFFTLEGLRGKPLSLKKMELAQQIGFSILLLLMGLALFNDILNLFRPI